MSIGLILRMIAGVLFALIIIAAYFQGKQVERAVLTSAIKDGRITVLKDGKEIDDEILNSGDDDLCAILGGCKLSVNE